MKMNFEKKYSPTNVQHNIKRVYSRSDNQYGFRAKYATEFAALELVNGIITETDNDESLYFFNFLRF